MLGQSILRSSHQLCRPFRRISFAFLRLLQINPSSPLVTPFRAYCNDSSAFSSDYEAKLTAIVLKEPCRVAECIRESMQHSRRRIIHFRNSVTYVTIVLQSRLHAKRISPSDVSLVVELLLKECVTLRQADIAHLLVRAALRFSQMGPVFRPSFLLHLFRAYRGNTSVGSVLRGIGDELQKSRFSPEEKDFLCSITYLLSGDKKLSASRLPLAFLACHDVMILLECLGLVRQHYEVVGVLKQVMDQKGTEGNAGKLSQTDLNNLFCTAVCSSKEHPDVVEKIVELGKIRETSFSDSAASVFLQIRLCQCNTFQEIEACETEYMEKLHVVEPPLLSNTSCILRCCDIILSSPRKENDAYLLCKVEYLHDYFCRHYLAESNSFMGERETTICVAILRGYGILGKYTTMGDFLKRLETPVFPNHHKLYEETLRWYSIGRQEAEAIRIKEVMTTRHIYHTVHAYQYLFNVLDTSHSPHLIQKYFREMRHKGIRLDGFITPILLRVFAQINDMDRVESLYGESKAMALAGNTNSYSPRIVIQMLRNYTRTNPQRCHDIIADAEKFNCMNDEHLQAECIAHFLSNHEEKEMELFLSKHHFRTPQIYRVLLKNASRKKNRKDFDKILSEVEKMNGWDERTAITVIIALSYFSDAAGVKKYVSLSEHINIIRTSIFYADVATSFSRLGFTEEVEKCWEKLISSKLVITMPVYHRFLDLYMNLNNIVKVQEVLDTMMRLLPPTTETVTTIIHTLGKMGRLDEMEAVFASMSSSLNASPTLSTIHSVMSAYAKVGNIRMMERTRQKITQYGFRESNATYSIMFEGYGRAKRFERIHKLLEEQQAAGILMDESGYLLLLSIFSREHLGPDIEALVEEMISRGVYFSNKLLASMAVAFASINNTVEMEKYIATLLSHPDCSPKDLEMVHNIYAKRRDVVKIQELLDNPSFEKTKAIYNASVAAFAKAGEFNKVAYLLSEMDKKHLSLSRPTSIVLSSLLVKAGKAELAQAVLNGSVEEQVAPNEKDEEEKEEDYSREVEKGNGPLKD